MQVHKGGAGEENNFIENTACLALENEWHLGSEIQSSFNRHIRVKGVE